MLKIINNIQNDEHVSKVHKSHTPGLIKTVFIVTKISIQPTKSGLSVNSFQRLKSNFLIYSIFYVFDCFDAEKLGAITVLSKYKPRKYKIINLCVSARNLKNVLRTNRNSTTLAQFFHLRIIF